MHQERCTGGVLEQSNNLFKKEKPGLLFSRSFPQLKRDERVLLLAHHIDVSCHIVTFTT